MRAFFTSSQIPLPDILLTPVPPYTAPVQQPGTTIVTFTGTEAGTSGTAHHDDDADAD